jgi:hypothetical protein
MISSCRCALKATLPRGRARSSQLEHILKLIVTAATLLAAATLAGATRLTGIARQSRAPVRCESYSFRRVSARARQYLARESDPHAAQRKCLPNDFAGLDAVARNGRRDEAKHSGCWTPPLIRATCILFPGPSREPAFGQVRQVSWTNLAFANADSRPPHFAGIYEMYIFRATDPPRFQMTF